MNTVPNARSVRSPGARRRAGHTLAELVVCTVAISILLGGMGSAIYVTARAARPGSVPANAIRGSTAVEEITSELRAAISFSQRSATAIQFTLADRDSDASPETIRYAWSGTPGDPLTRRYNGGNVVDFLEDVNSLQLGYVVKTVDDPTAGQKYYLRRITVALQVGEDASAQVHAAVEVLDAPEVATP